MVETGFVQQGQMFGNQIAAFSVPWWGWIAVAIILIVLTVLVIKFVKKIVVNTVLGVLALFAINFFGSPYGMKIEINFLSVVISAILGLAGVGALVILALLGIHV